MSLRAAALGFWRRSNLRINEEIASGKGQERPRYDMIGTGQENYIFTNPLNKLQNIQAARGQGEACRTAK